MESLYHKLKPDFRRALLSRFVLQLSDGERDLQLQERVTGRRYATRNWEAEFAVPGLTVEGFMAELFAYRPSASESINRDETSTRSAKELDPMQVLIK
jgi:hypothetical protein